MIRFLSKIDPKKLQKKIVLLRLDFNTEDDWRMCAVLPTIKFLLKNDCKIIILSHRGRPASHRLTRTNKPISAADRKFSLRKDAVELVRLLRREVAFIDHFDFARIKKTVAVAPRESIFLLENLRFIKGEEENDLKLAEQLALLGDIYVNDAFAVSHRANASVAAITKFLPSYAGLELESEIVHLSRVMIRPKRPLVMIVGGAKISDKLDILRYFRNKADKFFLGGGPANTMLAVLGMDVKKSLKDMSDLAAIKKIARYSNLVVPVDCTWFKDAIVDIGPKTRKLFAQEISGAATIVWSGPLGLIDVKPYGQGSLAIAKAIGKNRKALSVAGGGETVMFIKKSRLDKKFTFISTGGGAMLDFLAGKKLPGIEALRNSKSVIPSSPRNFK
jgi:phosphoglycerate kinase